MKYRKLRIAWSVAWSIAAVLLIALWVRSYWRTDNLSVPWANAEFASFNGCFEAAKLSGVSRYVSAHATSLYSTSTDEIRNEMRQHGMSINATSTLFDFYIRPNKVGMPFWLPLILFSSFAITPWLPWSNRFSLRTLLIATTLVAVALGMFVWGLR